MINPFSALTSKIFSTIAIAAITFGVVQTVRIDGFMFIDGYVDKLADERDAHAKTKADYAAAQKTAAELNRKQVDRIENEYAKIAKQSEQSYEKHLADNRRAVADFMRRQTTSRVASGTGTSKQPEIQSEAIGTGEMPDVSSGFAIVPVSDLELVAGAYAKLAALQDAAKGVGEVETVPTPDD